VIEQKPGETFTEAAERTVAELEAARAHWEYNFWAQNDKTTEFQNRWQRAEEKATFWNDLACDLRDEVRLTEENWLEAKLATGDARRAVQDIFAHIGLASWISPSVSARLKDYIYKRCPWMNE